MREFGSHATSGYSSADNQHYVKLNDEYRIRCDITTSGASPFMARHVRPVRGPVHRATRKITETIKR
jgi:hypothetical protein